MLKIIFAYFFLNLSVDVYIIAQNEKVKTTPEGNPNYIRDRSKFLIQKPEIPPTYMNRYRPPFDPAWMDYCDPYHCNDYWKQVCGLNREKMRFRYFQSTCHLILNNQCANYRGALKYDLVELKHCRAYVMFLRSSCPQSCEDEPLEPVCAFSIIEGHVVLFANQCSKDLTNCKNYTLQEYEPVDMKLCLDLLQE